MGYEGLRGAFCFFNKVLKAPCIPRGNTVSLATHSYQDVYLVLVGKYRSARKSCFSRNSVQHWGVRLCCWDAPQRVAQKVRTEVGQSLLLLTSLQPAAPPPGLTGWTARPPLQLDVAPFIPG